MQATFVFIGLAILAGLGHSQDMPKPGKCGVSEIKPKDASRIINGEAVIPHSRPYQLLLVGFFDNGTAKHYCGASLVKDTHALTAAHCVAGSTAKNLRIFPGVHNFTLDLLSPKNGIPGQQVFQHEKYNDKTLSNDVAVIRLQQSVIVDNKKVGLVCLADPSTPACIKGHPVAASGWGSMSGDPNRPPSSRPTQLQQVALQCIEPNDHAECKKLAWNTIFGIAISADKSKMCAYAEKKGVCFGDSGGPLVRERTLSDGTVYLEQVGIMSGTIDCSFTTPRPDLYANVRELNSWILDKIKASL